MTLLHSIKHLLHDPPPALAFEISEEGIASAHLGAKTEFGFVPLKSGVLFVSPLEDNVKLPDEFSATVRSAIPPNGNRKRRDATLVLPDYATRTAVLDFDGFPSDPKEQLSLVRFRMKKSVPFDIESAAVSYFPQPAGQKKFDVVAVVAPIEIVARYEAPFRAAGLNPGQVTTSSLAMLRFLEDEPGATVLAKLCGRTLSVMVLVKGVLKLLRCLELADGSLDEISADLFPTFVYLEDNFAAKADRLILCGFGGIMEEANRRFERDLGIAVEPLRTPLGTPQPYNAGLLGFVHGAEQN